MRFPIYTIIACGLAVCAANPKVDFYPNAVLESIAVQACESKFLNEFMRLTSTGFDPAEAYRQHDELVKACRNSLSPSERSLLLYSEPNGNSAIELDPDLNDVYVYAEWLELEEHHGWVRVQLDSGTVHFVRDAIVVEVILTD